MPILSVNPTKNNGASENIGITRYYDDVYFAGIRGCGGTGKNGTPTQSKRNTSLISPVIHKVYWKEVILFGIAVDKPPASFLWMNY